ncbi:hypothetical protein DV735_g3775, partial [Chaetothyriales sp. CBS 134920]
MAVDKKPATASPKPAPFEHAPVKPVITAPVPLLRRFTYAIRLWGLKFILWLLIRFIRLRHRIWSSLGPNLTKTYHLIRPTLEHRIYWPPSFNPKSGVKLPLFISAHGGGFALGEPALDDHLCRGFADKHGLLVVNIDYRKSPLHPFPTAIHDVAALIRAILEDTSLPVDHSRVVIGGYSAGANLMMSAVQFPDIRARVHGLLAVFPATDLAGNYRGPFRPTKDGRRDLLERTMPLFSWAYLPIGMDRTSTLVSPIYASREDFPKHMFFMGAECDLLVQETEVMAKRLAGFAKDAPTGTKWQKNGIRWKLFWDMQHGFTHLRYTGYLEEERAAAVKEFFDVAGEWMHKDVFGSQNQTKAIEGGL